ncbi:DNA helicase RecQ [Saprospiraceae bacterium]|nr:DNA helicase RecQ [Saprospiraceae bacterium]
METERKTINSVLKATFGYDQFRPGQQEVIEHLMDKKDTLVIMPTGGGKSICFQVPAIVSDGLTIVVSPLIALMEDQVESLKQNGVEAAALNSSISPDEQQMIYHKIKQKELKLLYVSPERINSPRFYDFMKSIDISFFAIDEAHCVSIWGNDFRSDYVELKNLKVHFPEIPIIALTATADATTREDIKNQLNIQDAQLFLSSFERTNILLKSMPAKDRIKFINRFVANQQGGAGIIYCLSRKSCESTAAKLTKAGINASFYHAGMPQADRSLVQRNFQNDTIQVICATIAFGMGIDKPNIRFVVHYNMPKNIESYYQEIGRAGRDGNLSSTVLFSNYNDFLQLKSFIDGSEASPTFKEVQTAKLTRMWEYSSGFSCRTNFILNYFGEFRQEPCGRCDNCKNPPKKFDGTVIAQKALSAVARSNQTLGLDLLINVLRGSGMREIYARGLDAIKTFGAGRDLPYLDWKSYITQLINQGLLTIDFSKNSAVQLTPFSMDILHGKLEVELVKFVKDQDKKTSKQPKRIVVQDELYEILRSWRNTIAKKKGIPAYTVLTNTTLEELSSSKPTELEDLYDINGIGQVKFNKYGQSIIEIIQKYVKN